MAQTILIWAGPFWRERGPTSSMRKVVNSTFPRRHHYISLLKKNLFLRGKKIVFWPTFVNTGHWTRLKEKKTKARVDDTHKFDSKRFMET